MKFKFNIYILLIISIFFVGCASGGPKYSEFAPSISNLEPDNGRIFVYRPSALGAAIRPDIKLNGKVIGEAISHGFFYVDLEPGNYEMITSTEVDRKLSFTLDNGQIRFVRLNIAMGFFVGHVYPELVEYQVANKEIQDCIYTATVKE